MKIEIGPGGKLLFDAEQRWHATEGGSPEVMQLARFAGQEVMAITDDQGGFQLHYLGFQASGFYAMESAIAAAPEFARRVLLRMLELVAE
jgi:hypothetical protein